MTIREGIMHCSITCWAGTGKARTGVEDRIGARVWVTVPVGARLAWPVG